MPKTRSVGKSPPRPPYWDPPDLGTNPEIVHPNVTERTSSGYEKREVLLPGIDDGPRVLAHGEQRLAGKLQFVHYQSSNDTLWAVIELCMGECDGLIEVKYSDGRAAPTANTGGSVWDYYWYPGTAGGTIDPNLVAVLPTWNEPFAGTCNVVVKLKQFGSYWKATLPDFVWRMRTHKCTLPQGGAATYTTNLWNQWYCIARSPEVKALPSSRVDAASFIAARDADIAAGRRAESHLLLMEDNDPNDVINTFRLMARAYWFWDSNKFKVVADRPGSSVVTYNDSVISKSSQTDLDRAGILDRPNKITIWYTDIANNWIQKPHSYPDFPIVGEVIEEVYRLPHLHDPAQVKSLAFYLYNSRVYDARVKERWQASTSSRQLGDIVTRVIESRGNLTIPARLVRRTKTLEGYEVELFEHNDLKFAEYAISDSQLLQSTLPDPGAAPPNVDAGSVTWSEELYEDQEGVKLPRGLLTFTAPAFAFLDDQFAVYVAINGGASRFWFNAVAGANRTAVLWENGSYSITIKSRNRITQAMSTGTTIAVTVVGKTVVPADVQGLTGGANGTQAFLWWQPSADKAIRSYEIRRGAVSDSWQTAIYDGQTNVTSWADEPGYGGTVRYFVKAIDAAGRYSANAATFDMRVSTVGDTFSEAWNALSPDAATFTRVAAGPGATGLWYGTGSLIVEVSVASGGWQNGFQPDYIRLAMLTRTFTPTTAENERSAGSYASVGAWATAVDDPRRGGAPLWAPLPAGAQGEIYQTVTTGILDRMREQRARLLSIEHSGSDVPGNVAVAQPFFIDDTSTPTVKHYGNVYLSSPMPTTRALGLRLSSNAANYQQLVRTVSTFTGTWSQQQMFHVTRELKAVTFASGGETTDGSGLFTVSYSYGVTTGQRWLSIEATATGTTFAHIVVDNVNVAAKTVRFKSYDAAGVALAGVKFAYRLTDNGGDTTGIIWA